MTSTDRHLTAAWLAANVDISCVQAQHTRQDIEALAATAREHQFVSAHVLPNRLAELRGLLTGSSTLAGSPVGFPSGGATATTKFVEAEGLLDDGVQELDIVVNIGRLKSGEVGYCVDEVAAITALVAGRAPTRLILEVSRLSEREIRDGCDIAVASGVDYVKTGTGWAGATSLEQVRVIAEQVGDRVKIKAAGGIRTVEDVVAMRAAGVSRFGINDVVAVRLLSELEAAE